MKRPILLAVLGLGVAFAGSVLMGWVPLPGASYLFGKQNTADLLDQRIEVGATPITQFEKGQPERRQFGRLEWRGGLVLSSPSKFFGGWSGLTIDPTGERLVAVSDTGAWLTARLVYENERPVAVAEARIGALRDAQGRPFRRWSDRDAESVTLLQGTLGRGEVLVSFEQNHRLLRFPVGEQGLGRAMAPLPLPANLGKLRQNKSLEAVCVLQAGPAKGSILTFAERQLKADGTHTGWLRGPPSAAESSRPQTARASAWRLLSVQPLAGYDITDCAGLPDGGLLLLERRFRLIYGDPASGVKMRIRRFSQAELMSDAVMTGEVLIRADRSQTIDNMEGMAVHVDGRGRTVITLISDDNFNRVLQQTVLHQFVIMDPPVEASRTN